MLHNPLVRDYVSLGNGYHVVDFQIPGELDGRHLREIGLMRRFELRALGFMRATEFLPCDTGDVALSKDDKLQLLGRRENLRRFADSF